MRPRYFHGVEPFGIAYAEKIFAWRQLERHFPTRDEHLVALDYVVCVLNHRIGDWTGWVGWNAGYNTAWNGLPYWDMVGYSYDFGNGHELVYQDGVRVIEARRPIAPPDPLSHAFILENDAQIGQAALSFAESGAPVFGWWGEPWPRVIGVFSTPRDAKLPHTIPVEYIGPLAVGGLPLAWLIEHARAAFP